MKKQSKLTNRNIYDLSRDYGIGFTSKGQEFYFDLEDYQLVSQYIWYIDNHGYVRTNINENGKRTYLFMHHLVMGVMEKNILVDHIHGYNTTNDNRKSNLRIATKSQNNINQKTRKDNSSGIKGVNKKIDRIKGKEYEYWYARIQVDNKRINLGRYKTFEEAVKARKDAEEKYFGEWSYDNSQKFKGEIV